MGSNMTLGKRIRWVLPFQWYYFDFRNYWCGKYVGNTGADKLANIYAPEVQVASEIFKEANQIRYDIRAFVMQDNDVALGECKKRTCSASKRPSVAQEL